MSHKLLTDFPKLFPIRIMSCQIYANLWFQLMMEQYSTVISLRAFKFYDLSPIPSDTNWLLNFSCISNQGIRAVVITANLIH